MKKIRKIALTEIQSLFFSPIAWFILIIFTVQSFMGFMELITQFVRSQEMSYGVNNITAQIFGTMPNSLFPNVAEYLYLYIPLLTMGLMSRELSSGSIKLLYSSPVTNTQIILGKYLSMMVFGLVMIAILLIPVIYCYFTVVNFDLPVALSGLLGIYLLICAYSAIGLFMSSLTSYQVVAGVGTLAVLAVLNYVGRMGQSIDFVRDLTYWFDMSDRTSGFPTGLISSEDVLYFVLVISLFLSLSILRLKAIRQKAKGAVVWGKYAFVVVAVFMLGYLTSRPAMKIYYDSTRIKQLTLTPNSQNIIKRATGPMTITTYVNILEENFNTGLPSSRNSDKRRFEQYLRFKPEIRMKYVYYYAKPQGSNLEQRFPGFTERQMVAKIASTYNIDSTIFKPVSAIEGREMLADENYRFLRVLERGDGRKTFLRIFDDSQRHPGEREISAALKRIVMELPVVGFVVGHGERSMHAEGDRGYSRFSQQRPFRYSLINQGFDVQDVTLDNPVPAHVNIIVLADLRTPMTPQQEANLDAYVMRGGNMVVAGDVNRQDIMNPIAEKVGMRFLPGRIVRRGGAGAESKQAATGSVLVADSALPLFAGGKDDAQSDFLPDFVVGNPTPEGAELAYEFREMLARQQVVTMPGCVAIDYYADKGFDVVPLLMSDDKDSWNELQTTDFIDGVPTINAATGEREQSLPMAVALLRDMGGRDQKIVVLGDADCISNGEISIGRTNVRAANYNMIMSMFYWLSDGEVPIDVRRPTPIDNKLSLNTDQVGMSKIWLVGILPFMLLTASLIIWLRRKGR